MDKIKISVVIPLYNKQDFIQKCLNSVLNQTYLPDEIIVINDGSTDCSLEIATSFSKQHYNIPIKIIDNVNQGVSASRNYGILSALYPFVALLDADDEWDEDYLSFMIQLINEFPDASMYSSNHRVKDSDGNVFSPYTSLEPGYKGYINNYFNISKKTPLVNSSKVILRKSVVLSVGGFPEDAVLSEDLYLWFKIASSHKVAHTNRILVTINQFFDHSRMARSFKNPYFITYYLCHKKMFDCLTHDKKSYIFSVYFKHVIGSLKEGCFKEALYRWISGKKFFGFKFFFIAPLFLIPIGFFSFARKLKRGYRSKVYV